MSVPPPPANRFAQPFPAYNLPSVNCSKGGLAFFWLFRGFPHCLMLVSIHWVIVPGLYNMQYLRGQILLKNLIGFDPTPTPHLPSDYL